MKQAQNQEKAPPWQNNRLRNAFRAVTQEINPRLEKTNAFRPGVLLLPKADRQSQSFPSRLFCQRTHDSWFSRRRNLLPARKGNSNVTNARAHAAFLDTRAAHTRIRISTPNLGVLIYVIGTTSRPTRRVGRLKPRGSGKLGRPPVPNATAKRCPS